MKFLRLLFVLFVFQVYSQGGGMWIPSLLEGKTEAEMKSLGCKLTAKDIYDANNSSLKDAVPHFNGGCTSEVISPKGLLLTNHHCGFGAIQNLSSVENDYLTNGFWAYKLEDELPNEGLSVTFVVKIEDVTAKAMFVPEKESKETLTQSAIMRNITELVMAYPKEPWQQVYVRPFYDGNQFLLFVVETFTDVRLVGTPPSSIGKFGSDTDNWVWPRHTGDFSLFRIYADKNNRPAAYSLENVPYKPKHFLPISLDGVEEDDFTLVFGYPGKTTEYLPAVAIKQIADELNPAKIEVRDNALKIIDGYMRKDNAIKIQYAAKYASTANYWKKWIGETHGIGKSNVIAIKKEKEKDFQENIPKDKKKEYKDLLKDFDKQYAAIAPYALAREYYSEIVLRNCELLSVGYKLYQLERMFGDSGTNTFLDRKNSLHNGLNEFYKDFNPTVDRAVFENLMELYMRKYPKQFMPISFAKTNVYKLADDLYVNSKLTTYDGVKELLTGDYETILNNLNHDRGFRMVKAMSERFVKEISPKYDSINQIIVGLQRKYMKAQLEMNKDGRIFPDANSTLRLTYGKVRGYSPKDAIFYGSKTYLEGVMEKYVPGDYEFDVPAKLIDLYKKKDYGKYSEKGKMPVCFIATNHTTGGNSGSPAIDAHGNLIGLNFDRVWEGTMSDIFYDPNICRNIMVDIRYVLFIIDKYAGAKNIIEEIKIVHPKLKN